MDFTKKKDELAELFKNFEIEKQKYIALMNDITVEQAKIQGEYRLIQELELGSSKEENPESSS